MTVLRHTKALAIAIIALVISASLAFGAEPPAAAESGLANAAAHAGKTVPVQGSGDDVTTEGEDGDDVDAEETEEPEGDEDAEEAGDNCLTDPTVLTEEELAAMRHGSLVCWAAQQETPEGYDNHGAFVREWAQSGKDKAPDAERGQGKGKGQAKGKNKGAEE